MLAMEPGFDKLNSIHDGLCTSLAMVIMIVSDGNEGCQIEFSGLKAQMSCSFQSSLQWGATVALRWEP